MADVIGAHSDNRQNDGDGKEEEPESEDPERKIAKENADPACRHCG